MSNGFTTSQVSKLERLKKRAGGAEALASTIKEGGLREKFLAKSKATDSITAPKDTTPKLGGTSGVSSVGLKKIGKVGEAPQFENLQGQKTTGLTDLKGGVPPLKPKPEPTIKTTKEVKDITKPTGIDVKDDTFTGKEEVVDDLDKKILDLTNQLNEEGMTSEELAETEKQIKYYEDQKQIEDRLQGQRDRQKEYDAVTGEIQDIQSSARLRRGQTSVKNLKANIAYLGNSGQPAQSAAKLDAIDAQIEEAQTTYNELVKTESLMKKARALGQESKAVAFEQQMDDLQDDLDDNVSSALQEALSKIDNAEINGLLYDEDAMEDFRIQLLADTDRTIAELSDRNFERRKFLLDQYKTISEESKIFESNKNTVNEDMSKAQGFYVNGNGDPIISADTGKRIDIPEDAPMEAVFDKKTGRLITFATGLNGEIVPTVTETYDDATFEETTIASYADLVNKGTIDIDDVPEPMKNSVIDQLSTLEAPVDTEVPDVERIGTDRKGNPVYGTYNPETKKYEPISDIAEPTSNISKEDAVLGEYEMADGSKITASKGTIDGINRIMSSNPNISFDLNNLYRTKEDQLGLYGKGRTAEELTAEGIDAKYADPEANVVTWTTESSHMTGNAIDVVLPEGEDKVGYFQGIDAEMNRNGFFRPEETVAKGDYGHYQFEGVQKEEVDAENLAFDITSVLPRDLYKTDADFERVIERTEKAVKELQDKGKEVTSQSVANIVRGFSINEDVDQTISGNLEQVLTKNAADTDRVDWSTVARYLNDKDYESADKYVRNLIEEKAKPWFGDEFVSTVNMNQASKDTARLSELILKNPEKIGAFDGRVNDFMRKFKDFPEMQELNTLLTMNQAQTRKYFAGSAVTPTEMVALEDFIGGNTKMTPNNLLTMLETITNKTEQKYIAQREFFGYTPIDRNEIQALEETGGDTTFTEDDLRSKFDSGDFGTPTTFSEEDEALLSEY